MRLASTYASLVLVGGLGCGGGTKGMAPDASTGADAAPDAPPAPAWWQPMPGDSRNWDIQLAAPFDLSAARTMYTLDLWDVVPSAKTIDYGDGDPVAVPAGALSGAIADLHARTPRAVVICRVDTGAVELARPDARKFPGYDAQAADCPTGTPAAGSVIGHGTGTAGECYLDIRGASVTKVAPLIRKRLDLAAQIGCDGIDPDRNDMAGSDNGFAVTLPDQNAWYHTIATEGHARELSVGMKDAYEISGETDDLSPLFDWAMVQRCAEYTDCDLTRPFTNLHKAVLAIDYTVDDQGQTNNPQVLCIGQAQGLVQDGLVKDFPPTSTTRTQCTP